MRIEIAKHVDIEIHTKLSDIVQGERVVVHIFDQSSQGTPTSLPITFHDREEAFPGSQAERSARTDIADNERAIAAT